MQKQEEAEVRNGSVEKTPSEHRAANNGRKTGWTCILRHLFPHKVRQLLAEHDALEEIWSALRGAMVDPSAMEEIRSGLQGLLTRQEAIEEIRSGLQRPLVEPQALEELLTWLRRHQADRDVLHEMRAGIQRLCAQGDVVAKAAWLQSDFMERALLLQGQLATHTISKTATLGNLADTEFRVFSQWGEDGIVEWLVSHVAVPNHRFVEFGVGNFIESTAGS